MNVKFLVDSGAYLMAINEDVVAQLGLEKVDSRLAEMANGAMIHLDVVVLWNCVLELDTAEKIMINPDQPYISKKPLK